MSCSCRRPQRQNIDRFKRLPPETAAATTLLALRLLNQGRVFPLVLLAVAVLCALISRALLVIAAASISGWWVLGVLVPFGPVFFRLSYPDEARRSVHFRYATIICLAAYLIIGPAPTFGFRRHKDFKVTSPELRPAVGYATEKTAPKPAATPSLELQRAVNAQDFESLRKWAEQLRLRKRDLLHSDTEGNRQYAADLALYNDALAKANAEKAALDAAK